MNKQRRTERTNVCRLPSVRFLTLCTLSMLYSCANEFEMNQDVNTGPEAVALSDESSTVLAAQVIVASPPCTNDFDCDDGLFCNGEETCSVEGLCDPGVTPCTDLAFQICDEFNDNCEAAVICHDDADCDDGNFCNGAEFCHTFAGVCSFGLLPECDDGSVCNGLETCDPDLGCLPGTSLLCDEDEICYPQLGCVSSIEAGGLSAPICDDGLFCNGAEIFDPEMGCITLDPPCPGQLCDESQDRCVDCLVDIHCDDGNVCNGLELCNIATNTCQSGDTLICSDGDACNGTETCDPSVGCLLGTPLICADDGNPCNGPESCHPATGCASGPPLQCDDGLFCNGQETCEPALGCVSGDVIDCDEGINCTIDVCDEASNSCIHVPEHGLCDNAVFCDGAEFCSPFEGCRDGVTPCGDPDYPVCNEAQDACEAVPDCFSDADCDDNSVCNGVETCDTTAGVCVSTGGLVCADDDVCDGTTTCHPILGCVADQPPLNCDDGLYCNGQETCDPVHGCLTNPRPCTAQLCDEANDLCADCFGDSDCNDGDVCNGIETCNLQSGECEPGTPLACDDDNVCNGADYCHATNGCQTGAPPQCDDGNACNGQEYCDPSLGCQPGTPPTCGDDLFCTVGDELCDPQTGCLPGAPRNCSDNIICTTDSCDEASNTCVHSSVSALCDDGLFCTGLEFCHPIDGCVSGGFPCGDLMCYEPLDACVAECVIDAQCSDGIYCNGVEYCDDEFRCNSSGDPCAGQACDEVNNACVECLIHADCADPEEYCIQNQCLPPAGHLPQLVLEASNTEPAPGNHVIIEAYFYNDTPAVVRVSGYQADLDCFAAPIGSTSGSIAVVLSAGGDPCEGGASCLVGCAGPTPCATIAPDFCGEGIACIDVGNPEPFDGMCQEDVCLPTVTVDKTRPDYLFACAVTSFSIADNICPKVTVASFSFNANCPVLPGERKYLGTLLYRASSDATGVFQLNLLETSLVLDQHVVELPVVMHGVTLLVAD